MIIKIIKVRAPRSLTFKNYQNIKNQNIKNPKTTKYLTGNYKYKYPTT